VNARIINGINNNWQLIVNNQDMRASFVFHQWAIESCSFAIVHLQRAIIDHQSPMGNEQRAMNELRS